MTADLVVPTYGRGALADLLPAVAAHLGVSGFTSDEVGLPASDRYVVLLVDGLGWNLLRSALASAPFFAALVGGARPITVGVPSTTATSLTSLGTGLAPGCHGTAGYMFRDPSSGVIFNALTWNIDASPREFQPQPTVLEQAAAAGVAVASVLPARFEGSGLTESGLRGGVFHGVADERDVDARVREAVAASRRGARSLVYCYERELDHTGHSLGVASRAWLAQLRRIDAFADRLRCELGDDVVLIVTGDHGMVDVPPERQVIVEDQPGLLADLTGFGGEGRFRQLYTTRPDVVSRRWRDRLGESAWVHTRDEAVDLGWFGEMRPEYAERFGDVVVAMRADWAVMTRTLPRELALVGQHGSLTPAEMLVPLLAD